MACLVKNNGVVDTGIRAGELKGPGLNTLPTTWEKSTHKIAAACIKMSYHPVFNAVRFSQHQKGGCPT